MTEMFQWPKCLCKKWPKCLSEKKTALRIAAISRLRINTTLPFWRCAASVVWESWPTAL